MAMETLPHLNFRGEARAALDLYQAVFGGDVVIFTYAQMGAPDDAPNTNEVVWGQVASPNGFKIMAFDVPADRPFSRGDNPFFVSVRGHDAAELTACWEKLAATSTVIVPLGPAAWAPLYGMLTDQFGITWVLDVANGG